MTPPAAFLAIAAAFWGGHQPACGTPTVATVAQPIVVSGDPALAYADSTHCRIVVGPTDVTLPTGRTTVLPAFQEANLCVTVVHEYGHLLLGPTAFALANSADPAHSPDPTSVMFRDPSPQSVPACARLMPPRLAPSATEPAGAQQPTTGPRTRRPRRARLSRHHHGAAS